MKRIFILFLYVSVLYVGIGADVSADDGVIVKVGVYENQPKIFTDEQGRVSGFWADILEYIAVKQLKEDRNSIYYQSLETWFGAKAIEKPVISEWGKWLLISIGLLAVVFAVFVFVLRIQVKRKTRELVRDRADIKLILDTSPVLIFYKDREGKFLRVNKAFAAALNITEEDFIGKTVFDLYSADIAQSMAADDRAVFKSGRPKLNIVEQYESGTGLRWVQTDKVPVINTNGEAVALVGFAVDITERQQAEEALQESEKKYRTLIEASLDPLVTINRDGKVTDVNKATEQATGAPRERLIGSDFSDYFTEPEKAGEGYNRVFAEGTVRDYALTLKHSSGSTMDVLYNATVYRDEAGEVQGVFAAARDITGRKRVEEALKASEIKYRRLFEAARDGILILNADTGLIIDVNPFMVEMLGFSHNEFLGKKIWELGLLKDIIANKENFVELQQKGFVRYEGLPLETAAGQRLEVEFVSNIYEVDHQKVIQCNIRDVTARKLAEQAKERLSQALKAQVSELETFSYGIAHDLKSPLISIEGFTHLLHEDLQNQKVENVKEDIRLLESGVKKMRGFLQSTLEYSRAGRLIKRDKDVSFSEIVNEALKDYNDQISAIGATVSRARTFPRVDVDRSMIIQVMANLIQNSLKYRDETVPLKIEIGCESSGETVFFVRDNGIGIAEDEAEKVFDLFYRGTSHVEGSGIGLKIAKKIIEAHGGRIWVKEGQPGQGTTVCFTLPERNGIEKRIINGKN
jgi:PAS domain S-box-containing protein